MALPGSRTLLTAVARLRETFALAAVLALLAAALPAQADDARPGATAGQPKASTTLSAVNMGRKAAWQQRLTLGSGDALNFSLYGRPELNRDEVYVDPNGQVTYLQAAGVKAAGLTIDELREKMSVELGKYYQNARVIITPFAFHSKKIYILGQGGGVV